MKICEMKEGTITLRMSYDDLPTVANMCYRGKGVMSNLTKEQVAT